jgi:predicted nucleic acid-binding Zn ribbon protein
MSTFIPARELVELEDSENTCVPSLKSMKECVNQFSHTQTGSVATKVSSLHGIWNDVAGDDIAQHVTVRHIKEGVLHVVADHAAWSTHMKYMQDQIVTRINNQLGEGTISSISLSVKRG